MKRRTKNTRLTLREIRCARLRIAKFLPACCLAAFWKALSATESFSQRHIWISSPAPWLFSIILVNAEILPTVQASVASTEFAQTCTDLRGLCTQVLWLLCVWVGESCTRLLPGTTLSAADRADKPIGLQRLEPKSCKQNIITISCILLKTVSPHCRRLAGPKHPE